MIKENGIIAGNITDKYNPSNPLLRWAMQNFLRSARSLILPLKEEIRSITEVGCGEGHLCVEIQSWGFSDIRACDVSRQIIQQARSTYGKKGIEFYTRSIYELESRDSADLMINAEVLEHLEHPRQALKKLKELKPRYCLFSVPNEPWWRMANALRGRYLSDLGNTPGHIQHWSAKDFRSLISEYFTIIKVQEPFPWTMVLAQR